MILKGNQQPKVFAPKPIRHTLNSHTCITPFQSKIPQFLSRESREMRPPKKKIASAFDLVSYNEMENDFCQMRRSSEEEESTEELFSIIFNTNGNNSNDDSSQSDSMDDQSDNSLNSIERCSNPFTKNLLILDNKEDNQ